MKSIVVILLLINIPFIGFSQNGDTLHCNQSEMTKELIENTLKNKSAFFKRRSPSFFKLTNRLNDSSSILNNKILPGSDSSLKAMTKPKPSSFAKYSDSSAKIKVNSFSKLKLKIGSCFLDAKNKFSKQNVDSNKNIVKGISNFEGLINRDSVKSKNEEFIFLDSSFKPRSKCAIKSKGLEFKLLSDSTKPNKDIPTPQSSNFKKEDISDLKGKYSNTDLIRISGSVQLESYNSTIDVPFSALNQNYQRLTLDATVKVLGLPLKTEGYFSTDQSGNYPSNMFRVYFDAESMKQEGVNKIEQIKETEQGKLKSKFNEAKEKQEKELKNALAFRNYYTNRKSYFEKNLNSQFKNLKLPENESFNNLLNRPDLSVEGKLQKLDSLKQINPGFNLPDTSALRKYLNTRVEMDRLDSFNQGITNKLKVINDKWNSDSLMFVSQIESNKAKLAKSKNLISNLSPSQLKGSLKAVQIGIISPKFSELSILGISVKGFSAKVGGKSWSLETFNGKTYSLKDALKQSPNYDMPILGFQVRTKIKKNEYFLHSAFLTKNIPSELQNSKMHLFGGGAIFSLLQNSLNGTIEVATIRNSKSFNIPVQSFTPLENKKNDIYYRNLSIFRNKALNGSLNYTNEKVGSLKIVYKNIQPEFENSLTPFLRKDFTETQLQWQKKYFKNKLSIKASYKYLSDNLQNIKPNTNKIKGFGVEAKSQFKNGLILSLMYQPYDLSNNNPDTLYRTRNKFSIFQSSVMYIVNEKRHLHVFSLLGMMNKTNYSGVLSQTYTLNGMANLSFNSKYLLELNAGGNFIPNNDDTLNYQSFGLNAGFRNKVSKRFEMDIYSQNSMMLYKSNGYLMQSGLTLNTKFKLGTVIGITGLLGVNKIISDIADPDFYTLKISIKHLLNYKLNKSNFYKDIK